MNKKLFSYPLLLTLLSAVSIVFVACDPDEPTPVPTIVVSPDTSVNPITFESEGGSQDFTIQSNTDWSITSIPDWMTVSPISGKGDNSTTTVTIEARQSDTDTQRFATLVVSGGSATSIINIVQQGVKRLGSIVGKWVRYRDNTNKPEFFWEFENDGTYRFGAIDDGELWEEIKGTYIFNDLTGDLVINSYLGEGKQETFKVKSLDENKLAYVDPQYPDYIDEYTRYDKELPKYNLSEEKLIGSWVSTDRHFEYIEFKEDGSMIYKWSVNELLADYDLPFKGVSATGAYSIDGNDLFLRFNNVSVNTYGNEYHGFKDGESATKRLWCSKAETNILVLGNYTYVPQKSYKPMVYGTDVSGLENGHNYVDLGLSVKWATTNLGASVPQDYGTTGFPYAESGLADDPAQKEWGGNWRLPTKKEVEELISKCTISCIDNGEKYDMEYNYCYPLGWKVTGPNGNSIYIPSNGLEVQAIYWTGTKKENNYGYTLQFDSYKNISNNSYASISFAYIPYPKKIRAVCK